MIDKVAWVHVVDGRVLVARSHGKDTFYVPGGKREPGESDVETLVREIREELSVDVSGPELIGVFEAQAHGRAEGETVRMTCYTATFAGELTLSNVLPAESYTLSGRGKGGMLGMAQAAADITLEDASEGTVLTFAAASPVVSVRL